MHSKVETITPELAVRYLSLSKGNRTLRQHHIDRMKRDIQGGDYKLTHQGVAFNEDGTLIDGHHRLTAIMESGIAVMVYVTRGVPNDGMPYIDGGFIARSISDAEFMAGNTDPPSNKEVSVAGVFECMPMSSQPHLSRAEILRVCNDHRDAIRFACKWQMKGLTRGARVLLARAFYHVEHDRLEAFASALTSGFVTSSSPDEDSAAITYRNFLIGSIGLGGISVECERYRKGQSCVQYFANRKPMTKTYGISEDVFPVPAAS